MLHLEYARVRCDEKFGRMALVVRERISNAKIGCFRCFLYGDAMEKMRVPCCDMSDARWIICSLQVAGSQNIGVQIGRMLWASTGRP